MKVKKSKSDLIKHLREQVGFLIRSSKDYDNGVIEESQRIALAIRVIVHDTANSASLLSQLCIKDILFFDSSGSLVEEPGTRTIFMSGLLVMSVGPNGAGRYPGLFDFKKDPHPRVSFEEWWNKIVFHDIYDNRFTRKQLVLGMANKDGGAHVDEKLDEPYFKFSKTESLGGVFVYNGVEKEIEESPLPPSIRQIGHEVIMTIGEYYPELVAEYKFIAT